MTATFDTLTVTGQLLLRGGVGTRFPSGFGIDPTECATTTNVLYPLAWGDWREDGSSYATVLPGTSAGTNLGLIGGTFGTSQPSIQTYNVHAAGALTLRARIMVPLPERYVAASAVTIRCSAGMITTVADTSCTLLIEAYRIGQDNTIGTQICPTGAVTMNSLVFSNKSFTITAATLSPSDVLDVRMTVAVNDAATGGSVIAAIAGVNLICSIQG